MSQHASNKPRGFDFTKRPMLSLFLFLVRSRVMKNTLTVVSDQFYYDAHHTVSFQSQLFVYLLVDANYKL